MQESWTLRKERSPLVVRHTKGFERYDRSEITVINEPEDLSLQMLMRWHRCHGRSMVLECLMTDITNGCLCSMFLKQFGR